MFIFGGGKVYTFYFSKLGEWRSNMVAITTDPPENLLNPLIFTKNSLAGVVLQTKLKITIIIVSLSNYKHVPMHVSICK